jgi:hypothetical protein
MKYSIKGAAAVVAVAAGAALAALPMTGADPGRKTKDRRAGIWRDCPIRSAPP